MEQKLKLLFHFYPKQVPLPKVTSLQFYVHMYRSFCIYVNINKKIYYYLNTCTYNSCEVAVFWFLDSGFFLHKQGRAS